jgi:hypothetical protein
LAPAVEKYHLVPTLLENVVTLVVPKQVYSYVGYRQVIHWTCSDKAKPSVGSHLLFSSSPVFALETVVVFAGLADILSSPGTDQSTKFASIVCSGPRSLKIKKIRFFQNR